METEEPKKKVTKKKVTKKPSAPPKEMPEQPERPPVTRPGMKITHGTLPISKPDVVKKATIRAKKEKSERSVTVGDKSITIEVTSLSTPEKKTK